eukprot:TRINITY_DN200_c1_g2_i1.p1 TRINITY_DN200_c1_g2~~TRINITY_DN200_c1_g2_i1.p1  ORF type:complete len:581 (+),score=188.88 TRINITY_DN200_c1_g2_i1:47-1744(+)
MASFEVVTVATKPFEGQKPGTSGLRKRVKEVQQPDYLENFIQSIFTSLGDDLAGSSIVLGGDGRFHNDVAIQLVIKIAAANGVKKVLVAQDGIFPTPAVSATIRARKLLGGVILTASHNPGGPEDDFGIKYNAANGGPAPSSLTDKMYEIASSITEYKTSSISDVDVSVIGTVEYEGFSVEVIDPNEDYIALLSTIFDFEAIKKLLSRADFTPLFDSLNGVTGPASRKIFHELLGADISSCRNSVPLPDFGGLHPDPNLVYAADLVKLVDESTTPVYNFGCAFDGDGDRNLVIGGGPKFFVTPSDSVGIIAHYATCIPYYKDGLKAVARSMPTSASLDRVAKALNIPLYETPTGWKFFQSLMGDIYEKQGSNGFICGEESFGTGSAHIREKDGIWAVLAWLSIIAHKNENTTEGQLVSVKDIVEEYWKTYGRNYYQRYDYEGVSADGANKMMEHLRSLTVSLKAGEAFDSFSLDSATEFEYTDPVDKSVTSRQGMIFSFTDGSRFVIRLSGTGSVGATIRLYLEKYEEKELALLAEDALKPLIVVALRTLKLKEFVDREEPSVIT